MATRDLHVAVRVDAGPGIGLGHIGRCVALTEAIVAHGGRVFFVTTTPAEIRARIGPDAAVHAIGVAAGTLEDADATRSSASDAGATAIVVDRYGLREEFVASLDAPDVLWIDDAGFAGRRHGLVLNHNVYASLSAYPDMNPERVLAGPSFALVRGDVVRLREDAARRGTASRVLVTMGGADPPNVTGKVLDAVARVDSSQSLRLRVIVGHVNPHRADVIARAQATWEVLVDPVDYAEHLRWCDVAVTAAGGTCLELATLGRPMVAIAIADNQLAVADGLRREGLASVLGWHADVGATDIEAATRALMADDRARESMSERQRARIDGRGKDRVVARLLGKRGGS